MGLEPDLLVSNFAPYLPISIFGVYRWSLWLVRKLVGKAYRPLKISWPSNKTMPRVSIVTPVYNEDPKIFALALKSWIENKVDEIIAIIDYSDTRNIFLFHELSRNLPKKLKLIVTRKPGKRPALADGIVASRGDIIALVDSDTIWAPKVKDAVLPYFLDEDIGGVTLKQQVYNPKTLSQNLFDMLLYVRYAEEVPFMVATGNIINTISGRTGFYRREALLNEHRNNIYHLTHEFFLGTRCISGDDKRLTHLIAEQGWHAAYQSRAVVYTPGTPYLKTFLKQRLRWTRNSWRADTRAFLRGWVWRHPGVAFNNLDRFFQPLFLLFGLAAFIFSIINHHWLVAGGFSLWVLLTRFLRLSGYFIKKPSRVTFLPAYIAFTYLTAVIRIYAWFTIVEQGWITRWHNSRLAKTKHLSTLQGSSSTIVVLLLIALAIFKWQGYIVHRQQILTEEAIQKTKYSDIKLEETEQPKRTPDLPPSSIEPGGYKVYVVQPGDNLTVISAKLNVPLDTLRYINFITNRHLILTGQKLYYP